MILNIKVIRRGSILTTNWAAASVQGRRYYLLYAVLPQTFYYKIKGKGRDFIFKQDRKKYSYYVLFSFQHKSNMEIWTIFHSLWGSLLIQVKTFLLHPQQSFLSKERTIDPEKNSVNIFWGCGEQYSATHDKVSPARFWCLINTIYGS